MKLYTLLLLSFLTLNSIQSAQCMNAYGAEADVLEEFDLSREDLDKDTRPSSGEAGASSSGSALDLSRLTLSSAGDSSTSLSSTSASLAAPRSTLPQVLLYFPLDSGYQIRIDIRPPTPSLPTIFFNEECLRQLEKIALLDKIEEENPVLRHYGKNALTARSMLSLDQRVEKRLVCVTRTMSRTTGVDENYINHLLSTELLVHALANANTFLQLNNTNGKISLMLIVNIRQISIAPMHFKTNAPQFITMCFAVDPASKVIGRCYHFCAQKTHPSKIIVTTDTDSDDDAASDDDDYYDSEAPNPFKYTLNPVNITAGFRTDCPIVELRGDGAFAGAYRYLEKAYLEQQASTLPTAAACEKEEDDDGDKYEKAFSDKKSPREKASPTKKSPRKKGTKGKKGK